MNDQHFLVTTALRKNSWVEDQAKGIANRLNMPYVARDDYSLQQLAAKFNGKGLLVVSRSNLIAYIAGQEFFYHPGMSKLRIKSLEDGYNDQMINAMGLQPHKSVLDCTLGLGSDALVASHVVGSAGMVIGLEINPLLAYIVTAGMKSYPTDDPAMIQALNGIKVVNCDYRTYLKALPSASVDVIYFDPMFRKPLLKSSSMSPLRGLAHHHPVDEGSLLEACRIARGRVVLKERANSGEFARLGFSTVIGGKNSPVAYGVIEVGGDAK